jgi:hypothetical protein
LTVAVLCLALAAVFALGAVSAAGAAKKKHKRPVKTLGSQITLTSVGPDGAEGLVSSPRAACVADRTVTLYMVGTESSLRTSEAVAKTQTRQDGSWSAALYAGHTLYTGEYYAVVQSERLRGVVCADAVSNDRSF